MYLRQLTKNDDPTYLGKGKSVYSMCIKRRRRAVNILIVVS